MSTAPKKSQKQDLEKVFRRAALQFQHTFRMAEVSPTVGRVHELRRNVRKLRTYLFLLPKWLQSKEARRSQKLLKELNALLGPLRTMDVSLRLAHDLGLPINTLKTQTHLARCHVKAQLLPSLEEEFSKSILILAGELRSVSVIEFEPKLRKIFKNVLKSAKNPPTGRIKRHQLRLRIKKINIGLDVLGSPQEDFLRLQKKLGQWHDLKTLEQFFRVSSPKNLQFLREMVKKKWQDVLEILTSKSFLKTNSYEV